MHTHAPVHTRGCFFRHAANALWGRKSNKQYQYRFGQVKTPDWWGLRQALADVRYAKKEAGKDEKKTIVIFLNKKIIFNTLKKQFAENFEIFRHKILLGQKQLFVVENERFDVKNLQGE